MKFPTSQENHENVAPHTYDLDTVEELLGDHPTIWVFGYGSLLWKPDFNYKSKRVGYIEGYTRRFYQGNITFRGKPGQPGRVANLEEKQGSQAWGVAYEICGREAVMHVLQALYTRETACGGYVTRVMTFYPRQDHTSNVSAPGSRIVREDIHDPKFLKLDPSTASPDHLYYPHQSEVKVGLNRVESNISDMSIDDSSDDELYDTDSSDVTDSYKVKSDVRFSIESFSNTSNNSKEKINNLMNYLYRNGLDKSEVDEKSIRECLSAVNSQPSFSSAEAAKIKDSLSPAPVQVLLYTVTQDNDLYLGPDDVTNMARQIVNASGSAGSNVEYVTKIADYVRMYIPEDQDSHLFSLDAKIREEVYRLQAADSSRLQLGFADLIREVHDREHEAMAEPVMAS